MRFALWKLVGILATLTASARASTPVAADGNWPAFRGPESRGIADDHPRLPSRWSDTENVLWKVELDGRGWSSPIVWGRRVVVTSAITGAALEDPRKGLYFGGNREEPPETEVRWVVTCLDLDTGLTLWETQVASGPPPAAGVGAPPPAAADALGLGARGVAGAASRPALRVERQRARLAPRGA